LKEIIGIVQLLIILRYFPTIILTQRANVVKNEKKRKKKEKSSPSSINFRFKLPNKSMQKWRSMFNKIEWNLFL